MKELLPHLSSQQFWMIGAAIFILLSVVRRNIFPVIGFALFAGLIIGKEFIQDEVITELIENVTYIYIGTLIVVGYSYLYTAFQNNYLTPMDEIILVFYGIAIALPSILLYIFFFDKIEISNKYPLAVIWIGVFLLFFWNRIEKFFEKHEKAYLKVTLNQAMKSNLIHYKARFGDKDLSEIQELALEALPQDYDVTDYHNYLNDMGGIYYATGKYSKALDFFEEGRVYITENTGVSSEEELNKRQLALARSHYYLGLVHEAVSTKDKALEHFQKSIKFGSNSYYVKTRIAELTKL